MNKKRKAILMLLLIISLALTSGNFVFKSNALAVPSESFFSLNDSSNEKVVTLVIGNTNMNVDGTEKQIDPGKNTVPVIINNRTLLPIRAVIESLGGKVDWSANERKITATLGNSCAIMWINKYNVYSTGEIKNIDTCPMIINDRTFVPVRFLAENLGCSVEWNQSDSKVIVRYVNSSSFDKRPTISGIPILPSDNPFNMPIDHLPLNPNSSTYIQSIGPERNLHPDFGTFWEGDAIGIPYNIVDADQPKTEVQFEYDDESDIGPYPIPINPMIEAGSDRHMLILQKGSNILYELFAAEKNSDGSWSAGSGAIWNLSKNEVRPEGWTSADAAGLPILPGLVRWDEVYEKGEINHAIRFTLSKIQKAYIKPASHSGGRYTEASYPPMGLRMRLKPDFDISGYDTHMQVILKALKRYGIILADVGSNMYITGSHDTRWNDEILNQLKKIKAKDFEAVYTGEIIPY